MVDGRWRSALTQMLMGICALTWGLGVASGAHAQSERVESAGSSRIDPVLDQESEDDAREGTPRLLRSAAENGFQRKLERKDIQSHFASGPLSKAKQELDRRHYDVALHWLDKLPPSRPARYLRAMCHSRMKNPVMAAAGYTALADEWSSLRNHLLFQAGTELEAAGQSEQASVRYRGISQDALEYPWARLGLARTLESRGDLASATEVLHSLVSSSAAIPSSALADAWVQLARLARASKDANAAERADYTLWAMFPSSSHALWVQKRLGKREPPVQWRVLRAERLISVHQNVLAQSILESVLPWLQLPDPLACRAHFALGTALRKERKHTRAVEQLRPVVEVCPDAELRPRAMFVLGYSESVVDPVASIGTYRDLARNYPTHPYADEALLFASEQEQWRGDSEAALALLQRIVEEYPRGTVVADALFKRFWIAQAEGRWQLALDALVTIENLRGTHVTQEQLQRARYWRAQTLTKLGRKDEPAQLLESVAQEGAAGYYGLLARSRLQSEGRTQPSIAGPMESSEAWPLEAGPLWEDAHFRAGLELTRLENPAASNELLAVNLKNQTEESYRLLIHLLDESGFNKQATTLARSFLKEGWSGPSQLEARRIYEIAYPHSFRALVEEHSRAAQIDPNLMQALIREESAFNPRARSSTGAMGLSQLMPFTAKQVARSIKAPKVTERSLLDPKQNIRLGSAYLGDLTRRFSGNFAYAVASYNAGPNAVRRWLKKMPTAELDAWVEEIPVAETRNYVKRVLGSYVTYELLYATGAQAVMALGPSQSPPTPEN